MKKEYNLIMEYLDREHRRARKANDTLQCAESGARLHEIENVGLVVESLIAKMDTPMEFKVELMNSKAKMPAKAHPSDAGWDICSNVMHVLHPSDTFSFPTGIKLEIPEGWEAQVRSRSGLAIQSLFVLNSPGTIDAGYRGEIRVILRNSSPHAKLITEGMKIAQLVFQRVENVQLTQVEKVDTNTDRSEAGFGSSDKQPKETK